MPRVVLCGDMTTSGLVAPLHHALKEEWQVEELGFNQWFVEMLNEASQLHRNKPDYLIILLSPRYLQRDPDAQQKLEHYLEAVDKWEGRVPVLFSQFIHDPMIPEPLIEAPQLRQKAEILNGILRQFQKKHSWFHILDMASFFITNSFEKTHDPRFEILGRMFFSPSGAKLLAAFLARYLRALTRTPKKVLVVDLDNTLWGGILGEEEIKIGDEGIGYGYAQFQRALQVLKNNGVLLAINSKNNENDVVDAFKNPGMILKITDFAAHRINWLTKVENLQSLAHELSLGLDSFAVFDDSSFEREQLRRMLPEVDVIEVPSDVADYIKVLSQYPGFDKLSVTEEDRARSRMYEHESERKELQKKSASLEEFYQSLAMEAEVSEVGPDTFERVHQLIQKTNQFNLTTKRYTESELRELMRSPNAALYSLRLKDKLGDSGLTGVAILRKKEGEWAIDTLLLSCRIIGRTVEYALIQWLADKAQQEQVKRITGQFIPTKKNQPAVSFYQQAGFAYDRTNDQWILDLQHLKIPRNYVSVKEKM